MNKQELGRKYFSVEFDGSGSLVSKELRKLVEKILIPFRGGFDSSEKDEFYSIAGEVFTEIIDQYDPDKGNFDAFFSACLSRRIKDYFRRKNRDKRMQKVRLPDGTVQYIKPVSIDEEIREDREETLADCIPDNKTVEDTVFGNEDGRAERYLATLSQRQRKIVELLVEGYSRLEIMKMLELSGKIYDQEMSQIRSFEKISILREKKSGNRRKVEQRKEGVPMAKLQNSKTLGYQVSVIADEIQDRAIRLDYCLQRYPGQWNEFTKYNYIADIIVVNWIIDGCQRISTVVSYRNNEFKIGKNVERYMIPYQRHEMDSDGNDIYINEEFDIRGKQYRQLPRELQRSFDSYTIHAILYMGCSKQDIEYHLRRYNRCTPMTKQQKAVTYISEEYGKFIRKLSGHAFFKNNPLTEKAKKNGDTEKMVIDSIMMTFFQDHWNKDVEKNAIYLKENLNETQCGKMTEILDRLDAVWDYSHNINKEYKANTYLFIALFSKFTKTGLPDEKFMEFYNAFVEELYTKAVEGMAFNEYKHASRDKSVVEKKYAHLATLMMDFLGVKEKTYSISCKEVSDFIEEFSGKEFIKILEADECQVTEAALKTVYGNLPETELEETANSGFTEKEMEIAENVLDRLDDLEILSGDIDSSSAILSIKFVPALIAALNHGYTELEEDRLTEEWFRKYGNEANPSDETSAVEDLDKYIQQNKCA